MRRILLFAATTGYQTRSFAEAARSLGVDVALVTDRCHVLENPWGDNAIPIRFETPDESVQQALQQLQGLPIDGLIAVADKPTRGAAIIAEALGLPWHPPLAAVACRDKSHSRRLFEAAGLPVPRYQVVQLAENANPIGAEAGYPCVLKPLSLSGSRGVIRANNPAEFIAAFERIRRIVPGTDEAIQVEQYIPGREFALEGVMNRGRLRTLAIFDKPDPLEGPWFEETIYVTPSRESAGTQHAIVETAARAATALGLFHGAIHAEMRVNENGVYMLEIAARPIGGLCARTLRFRTPGRAEPVSLEQLLVLHAIGEMPAALSPAVPAAGVMMIPVPRAGILQAVSGVDRASAIPGIEDVVITAKVGEKLVPLPEGSSYTGFIFASGSEPEFVEQSLRRAHGELRFDILSALAVLG